MIRQAFEKWLDKRAPLSVDARDENILWEGYEAGAWAGLGEAAVLLHRCEPFIAGLTRGHKSLKHEATGLHHDVERFLKGARP